MPAQCIRGLLPWHEYEPLENGPIGNITGTAAIRSRVFPVVDLAGKLGLPRANRGRNPCIVVVELTAPSGPALAGFIADVISDIVQVRERDFIGGKLRTGGRPRTVLDLVRLLASEVTNTAA